MALTVSGLMTLGGETLRDPRGAARRLIDMGLPERARWEALALIVVLTGLVSGLIMLMMPPDPDAPPFNPLASTFVQAGVVALAVYAVHHVGRAFGGTGRLSDAVLLMAWLQTIMLGVQVVQIFAQMVIPALGGLVLIAGIVLFIWLLVQFVMELHGFESALKVMAGVIATMMALGFVISMVLAPFL